ncbi:NAD-dependent epimerase/dehydratase family protein [Candidatus Lucifugimonas marina]|uniref:NAD-dependent epimerase/dehydratase family protein n=1 Tax=Candidatus Lucifugimonas marina TaxID=3038979 RepID=A0ABD4XME9_9CHLR|nr:NAD-dependent epimerase/dehydratase family protein [SAR202 cluster bacterium JH702]MDG0868986.1 NAD-dependent epimerase/dehydratase family protein [SAR202 cluster bacterium JH639]WFG35611.1 NAD-dependent epimerase/dehydratase family protein [SAR202 cluster bacterium JH545]
MAKRKVLMTGASGYIASLMLPTLRDRFDMVLADVSDTDRDGNKIEGIQIANFIDTDRSKYAHLFEGVDAVIHLAFKPHVTRGEVSEKAPIDRFDNEHENVQMANNIYRSAYDAGVRRLAIASSNHAADWYEHSLIHDRKMDMVRPTDFPISDNFYGWAKAAYELLAYPYACGIFGRKLETVMLRIGFTRPIVASDYTSANSMSEQTAGGLAEFKRNLGARISPRDITQLFTKAVEAPNIENEHGVPFVVAYGCSDNTRRFWSLETARKYLDYQPEDDTEITYAKEIAELITGPEANVRGGKVGI